MASFVRGFRLPGLRPFTASPASLSSTRARFFTNSAFRCRAPQAAAKAARPPQPRPQTKLANAAETSPTALSRYAFIKSLAAKQTPTVLYEGPSHFWFYFGCWTSGVTIILWTALTSQTSMDVPDEVPRWVPTVFGVCYLILGGIGFFIISKTPGIVSRIRVLPTQAAQLASGAPATAAAGAPKHATLQMEVTVKRMIPLLSPKVITAPLEKVTLESRLSLPEEFVPELRRQQLEREAEEKRKQLWKFDMEHLLTMPFRRVGRGFTGMFQGIRAAWTDMGFGGIEVEGKRYKVDVTKGFAHEGFRTLEKLVAIKE